MNAKSEVLINAMGGTSKMAGHCFDEPKHHATYYLMGPAASLRDAN